MKQGNSLILRFVNFVVVMNRHAVVPLHGQIAHDEEIVNNIVNCTNDFFRSGGFKPGSNQFF